MATLRDLGLAVNTSSGIGNALQERDVAAGMGNLRRGWETGRIGNELNPLYTDELDAQIAGDEAKRLEIRTRIDALKQRQSLYAPEVGRVEDINGIGDGLSWAAGQVGQGVASMLDPMAAAAGLGVVGRVASHHPGPGKAIGLAAQGASMLVPAMMSKNQMTGEFIGDAQGDQELMARTPLTTLRDMAGDYGTLAAIPDSALPGIFGRQISGLSRAGSTAARQAAMNPALKTGLGMTLEGGTEALQSAGSQYAQGILNPNRDTSGDFMENVNSFAGGAVGAGPFAAAGAYTEAGHNRLDAGVDAVKGAVGDVIDTFDESPTVQAGKEKVGKWFGQGKDKVIDVLADEDGEISVGGVVGKASDQMGKWKRSAEELHLLANDTPPAGLDEVKTAAWFDQNDAKRDVFVKNKLTEMADDPEAQAILQTGDISTGAEFLIARHDLTQLKAKYTSTTQKIAGLVGQTAAAVAKGAFGVAKDVVGGAVAGFSKKNMQSDDPYMQWQERMSFPNAKGESDAARGKTDGMRTAAEDASYRRALLFGRKLANAATEAGLPEISEGMQDIGFQIAGWINMDKAMQAKNPEGMQLAIGEIGNDLRAAFGSKAATVIGEMERISGPEHAGLFQLLKEEAVRSGTPEGRALREQLRSTAADKLLLLLPKEHYLEATSTAGGPMKLLAQIERLAAGGFPKGTREEVEKVYGRSRLNAMFNIVGGLNTDVKHGGEEQTTVAGRSMKTSDDIVAEIDDLERKDAERAMERSRQDDIYGFRGNLSDRSRKDFKDVFAASSKLDAKGLAPSEDNPDGIDEYGDQFNRPQLFRTTTDAKGNIADARSGKYLMSTKIAEMKRKVGNTHEVADDGTESGETNGWGVEARSAHDIMNDQGMSPQKRLQLYRTYLRQDTRTNEGRNTRRRPVRYSGRSTSSSRTFSLAKANHRSRRLSGQLKTQRAG